MFSCTDPAQNQLLTDSSISIKDGNPNWWMSPDIILTSSLGVSDEARSGENNSVRVLVRKTGGFSGTQSVVTQLWVANPSLNIAPNVNAVEIQPTGLRPVAAFVPHPNADPGQTIAEFSWAWRAEEALANPLPTEDPTRLHRCLIARCYPADLNPPETRFCVTEDQHVAQRNIAIVPVFRRMLLSFPIETIGTQPEEFEAAQIRAFVDRVPSEAVLNAVLPSLKQFKGFRQIAQIAPERFALQVPERFSPVIRDKSQLEKITPINPGDIPIRDTWRYVFRDGFNFEHFRNAVFNPNVVLQEAVAARKFNAALNVRSLQVGSDLQVVPRPNITPGLEKLVERAAPTFEADIKLPPKEVANFTFTANLPENSQSGDAHIFHVMHINERQQVIGGLTIVAVVVDSCN